MNSSLTIVYFDYGGCYSNDGDEYRWISRNEELYSLAIRKAPWEVSYSMLVDILGKKIMAEEALMIKKISYIPFVEAKKPIYLVDDDTVLCYMIAVNHNNCRSILNVEIIEVIEQIISCVPQPTDDVSGSIEELPLVTATDPLEQLGGGADKEPPNEDNSGMPEEPYNPDNFGTNEEAANMYEGLEITPCGEGEECRQHQWEDGIGLFVGQEFNSKKEVQVLVERGSRLNSFDVWVRKSDTKLLLLKCRQVKDRCTWSLRVAKRSDCDLWSVRTYNNIHTCSRATSSTTLSKRKGTPRLVAAIVHENFPGIFDTPAPKSIISMVQTRLGVKVSYSTALRGKKQAIADVRGCPEDSYKLLPSYLYMLEMVNDGTITRVEVDEESKFKYMFFALGACIEGFDSMRKVIIVDGTFLKSLYGGVLIVATAQDPNHHNYPIAFGVVDGEKNASWSWFLNSLKTVIPDNPELVFVSDRNASIIKSIGEVYPMAQHGYCIYHLSQNVKMEVSHVNKDTCAKKFRECAQAYTESEFNKLYNEFRKIYPAAAEYLDRSVSEKKWARCYFPGERYNIDTSNCAESINFVFRDARKYSLLPMIDSIVNKLAEWFNKHRKSACEVSSSLKLVPLLENEFHIRCADARLLPVTELNSIHLEYIVVGKDGNKYVVDLTRKTCSCKQFDIDRYPCVHAIAVARYFPHMDIPLDELCSKYYLMEAWTLAYYRTIYPVPHRSEWSIPDHIRDICIIPPDYEKPQGRIRETRFPSVGEHRGRKGKKPPAV